MGYIVYTYSNPYEIDKEAYWNEIKDCPHYCVSQTMVNGLYDTLDYLKRGQLATVIELVNCIYSDWNDNVKNRIEQYAIIDKIIRGLDVSEKTRNSLLFNKKYIVDSIRLLSEISIDFSNMKKEELSEGQTYLLKIIKRISSQEIFKFNLRQNQISENEINTVIIESLKKSNENNRHACLNNITTDKIVFHGIHQFSPLILRTIEEISKYKDIVLLFNYQKQYKNLYQTWIDVYSCFDAAIKSPMNSEFQPSFLLANSFEGNSLAARIGDIYEGVFNKEYDLSGCRIIEFDNNTEFANYVAEIYEDALNTYDKLPEKEKEYHRSPLYYMKEQFYSANSEVNDMLKVYYPEQFGDRHFLSYPIGQFFVAIADMWNPEKEDLVISDLNPIMECLSSGIVAEIIPGALLNAFCKVQNYFSLSQIKNINDIVTKSKSLQRSIERNNRRPDEVVNKLVYYQTTKEELDDLIKGLLELNAVAKFFFEDFKDNSTQFKAFYLKVREFLENNVNGSEELDNEFGDIIKRLLVRLDTANDIEVNGTFVCLKETMGYYLGMINENDNAKWIVRDFEQIDGDVLKSEGQDTSTIYHFCCLSDEDMNIGEDEKLPWPLDIHFFETACEPIDWKYQVYIKSMKEFKNFKRYALVYGLEFNRAKYKLSYVKNADDKEKEVYYLIKMLRLQINTHKFSNEANVPNRCAFNVNIQPINNLSELDFIKYKICPYKFLLESCIEGGAVIKEKFLIKKYCEAVIGSRAIKDLKGQRYVETTVLEEVKTQFLSLKSKFAFIEESDEIDIETNACSFIKYHSCENDKNPKKGYVPELSDDHLSKKQEFIKLYLKENGSDDNILASKIYVNPSDFSRWKTKAVNGNISVKPEPDLWCQYCSNKEICLSYYSVSYNGAEDD